MSEPDSQSSEEAETRATEDVGLGDPDRAPRLPAGSVSDGDLVPELVDVTNVPPGELRVSGDSAVAKALRRLHEDLSCPDDVVAGFNSAI